MYGLYPLGSSSALKDWRDTGSKRPTFKLPAGEVEKGKLEVGKRVGVDDEAWYIDVIDPVDEDGFQSVGIAKPEDWLKNVAEQAALAAAELQNGLYTLAGEMSTDDDHLREAVKQYAVAAGEMQTALAAAANA